MTGFSEKKIDVTKFFDLTVSRLDIVKIITSLHWRDRIEIIGEILAEGDAEVLKGVRRVLEE